jgi:phosphoenolpyruvate-protein kinase (PTS system EI component)
LWDEHAARLARRDVSLGVMIEVPAAALFVRQFAAEVDFLSIGTNDLAQYLFAAERGNPDVAGLNDAWHPAVLRLIHEVCEAAHSAGRWAGVCGELAADPAATALLIGLGVDELSMSAPAIAKVKQAVRASDASSAKAMAERVLTSIDADEARRLSYAG